MNAEINILQRVENIGLAVITRVNKKKPIENYGKQVDGFLSFLYGFSRKRLKRTTITWNNITHLMNRKQFIAKLKALL